MSRRVSPAFLAYGYLLLAPLLCALGAVLLGKEAGWDFQNYHWYNPYALLNQRLGFDVAVAHHATYYNPLSDLPFYWIAMHSPAWLAGAFLGALYGVVVALIGVITYVAIGTLPGSESFSNSWRMATTALLCISGICGGGALPALGNTSNDVPAAIGIFAALAIVVWHFAKLHSTAFTAWHARILLLAGVCAGTSVGLKLTTATYAMGLGAAILVVPSTWPQRARYVLWLGIGMFVGFMLCAGPWLWRMWDYGANPLFPYFNQWFHSPLLVDGSYRDATYAAPADWPSKLLYPWIFTWNSYRVAEWHFRDAHILVAYVLIPISALVMLIKSRQRKGTALITTNTQTRLTQFLFCFAAVTYVTWLILFGIYRYLIPLEMLAPVLIALAIMTLPMPRKVGVATIAILLLGSQAVVSMTLTRQPWDASYVEVKAPHFDDPRHSMILLAGTSPMGFVVPSFPKEIPFLRVDGWLVWKDDFDSGLARQMRQRVMQHRGPLFILFTTTEAESAHQAAQAYGLKMLPQCVVVVSNIADPLQLCSLQTL